MGEQSGAWPRYRGELRSGRSAHVLPGVLSARMWIKQRNQECEDLLTRWAEPLSLWSALLRRRLGEAMARAAAAGGPRRPLSIAARLRGRSPGRRLGRAAPQPAARLHLRLQHRPGARRDARPLRPLPADRGGADAAGHAHDSAPSMPSGDGLGVAVFNPLNGPRTRLRHRAAAPPRGRGAAGGGRPLGAGHPLPGADAGRRRVAFRAGEPGGAAAAHRGGLRGARGARLRLPHLSRRARPAAPAVHPRRRQHRERVLPRDGRPRRRHADRSRQAKRPQPVRPQPLRGRRRPRRRVQLLPPGPR